jgi:hypothetical protein
VSYVEAEDVLGRIGKAEDELIQPGQLRVYAPIDDLELAHLIVDQFNGMQGLARELKLNYDEAADPKLKVRILSKVLDFVQTVAAKGGNDPGSTLAEMQKDMEERARAIMADSLAHASKSIGHDE